MSKMEMCAYRFKEAEDQTIIPVDEDEFYDMEEKTGFKYVLVNNKVYQCWSILDLDYYGFETILPIQDGPVILAAWYNGGGSIHEVLGGTIKEFLDDN